MVPVAGGMLLRFEALARNSGNWAHWFARINQIGGARPRKRARQRADQEQNHKREQQNLRNPCRQAGEAEEIRRNPAISARIRNVKAQPSITRSLKGYAETTLREGDGSGAKRSITKRWFRGTFTGPTRFRTATAGSKEGSSDERDAYVGAPSALSAALRTGSHRFPDERRCFCARLARSVPGGQRRTDERRSAAHGALSSVSQVLGCDRAAISG